MSNIPVKEIGEMFDEISEKLPKLIKSLVDTLYSDRVGPKNGAGCGQLL